MSQTQTNPHGLPTSSGKLHVGVLSDRELMFTRVFNAPRELVFRAWTEPQLIRRWLGVFGDITMDVCEVDLRVGGAFRYVWVSPNMRMGLSGTYQEIVRPERLAVRLRFDESWYPGDEEDVSVFTEKNGKTTLVQIARYASKEARDIVLASPAEYGVSAGYDNLDTVLASLGGAR
ncbi:MAG: SRPBCC family protein [Myxococcota bacterium]